MSLPRVERWFAALLLLALLASWEAATRASILSALIFPAPTTIFAAGSRLASSGALALDLEATLTRVFVGLGCGAGLGLGLGLLMGWSPRLRRMIDPLIAVLHPLPKIAILPLLMLVVGIGESSKHVLIALGTFFPMLINAMEGVRQINPIHFQVAQNYGANLRKLITRVILPGALPAVLTGLRLAFNIALLLAITVEIATAREGLGSRIWLAWQTFRIEELYVALFVIGIIGFGFNILLRRLNVWLAPWRIDNQA